MRLLFRLVDWRHEFLLFAVAAMDTCWVYPWIAFFLSVAAGPRYVIPLVAVGFWYLSAIYVSRALNNLTLDLRRQQALNATLAVLAVLAALKFQLYGSYPWLSLRWLRQMARDMLAYRLALPPHLLIFLLGLLMWAWGLQTARNNLRLATVGFHFRLGIVSFMLYILAAALGAPSTPPWLMLLFFYFGLVALALGRITEVGLMRGGARTPFGRSWLIILIVSAALVLLLALFATSLFSLDHIRAFFDALRPITEPLGRLLARILIAVLNIIFWFIIRLINWVRSLMGEAEPIELELPQLDELDELPEEAGSSTLLHWIKIGRDAFLIGLVLSVVLLVFLAFRRQLRRRVAQRDEMRESVFSRDEFVDDLVALLRGGWARLRDGADNLARRLSDRYSLISIRRIYASLNALAAERGYPRGQSQTPYEYRAVLQRAWPEQSAEISFLTEAYVRAHYGSVQDAADTLRRAREAWEVIRRTLPAGEAVSEVRQ